MPENELQNDVGAEVSMSVPEPQPAPQPPPEVWVRFANGAVTASHQLPSLAEVSAHLPKVYQKMAVACRRAGYRTVEAMLGSYRWGSSIPRKTLVDAIGAAICATLQSPDGERFESNPIASRAYLAIGDSVYKLQPIASKRINTTLAVVRTKIMDAAKLKADSLVQAANNAAAVVLADANRQRAEAAEARRVAAGEVPMAAWARTHNVPMIWFRSTWWYQLMVTIQLDGFDTMFIPEGQYTSIPWSWTANPAPPVTTRLWVPIKPDGSYAHTSIRVQEGFPELPHVSAEAACFSAGDMPQRIETHVHLLRLGQSIERCMRRVQLDSLRTAYGFWYPAFRDAIPDVLHNALSIGHPAQFIASQEFNAAHEDTEEVEVEVESEEGLTWTA